MKFSRCFKWALKLVLILYLLIFGIIPLIFRYSQSLQEKILFLNFINVPVGMDFSKPEIVGLMGARNFYITTDQNISIGTWQMLPRSMWYKNIPNTREAYESALHNSGGPIFVYMHGNGGNRASSHRVELYQLFQQLDYHIIAFDYRSYGDSGTAKLSESGIVEDSKYVIKWLRSIVNKSSAIFVWGHSLGTAVATSVLAQLEDEGVTCGGLFLEGAFNNLADEISEFPLAKMFKHLPWFHWAFVHPYYDNHLRFESDKNIAKISSPIMLLHAYDDNVVPIKLAEKLYEAAKESHPNDKDKIQITKIDSIYRVQHNFIYRFPKLPFVIRTFVTKSLEEKTI